MRTKVQSWFCILKSKETLYEHWMHHHDDQDEAQLSHALLYMVKQQMVVDAKTHLVGWWKSPNQQ